MPTFTEFKESAISQVGGDLKVMVLKGIGGIIIIVAIIVGITIWKKKKKRG